MKKYLIQTVRLDSSYNRRSGTTTFDIADSEDARNLLADGYRLVCSYQADEMNYFVFQAEYEATES